mgnify:CR=1 FL=1|jgi:hypothetical protein
MAQAETHEAKGNGNAPPPSGHNIGGLTDEERDALATHFALKIIRDQKVVALKKAEYDAAKAVVNGHFKLVKKELGETRQDFERDVIAVMGMTEAEYLAAEAKRLRRHQMAGAKPPGAQLDLIERINDTVDDAIDAEADGYRAGRRGDDPVLPSRIDPIFAPDWQRGWTRGQEVNAKAEALAAEILARPKPGEMAAADDDVEDDADDDSPEALDAKAKRLVENGWADPTDDEQSFEGEPAGEVVH